MLVSRLAVKRFLTIALAAVLTSPAFVDARLLFVSEGEVEVDPANLHGSSVLAQSIDYPNGAIHLDSPYIDAAPEITVQRLRNGRIIERRSLRSASTHWVNLETDETR